MVDSPTPATIESFLTPGDLRQVGQPVEQGINWQEVIYTIGKVILAVAGVAIVAGIICGLVKVAAMTVVPLLIAGVIGAIVGIVLTCSYGKGLPVW